MLHCQQPTCKEKPILEKAASGTPSRSLVLGWKVVGWHLPPWVPTGASSVAAGRGLRCPSPGSSVHLDKSADGNRWGKHKAFWIMYSAHTPPACCAIVGKLCGDKQSGGSVWREGEGGLSAFNSHRGFFGDGSSRCAWFSLENKQPCGAGQV